ncbi:hypothetical protein R1sor_018725 [Riccia sorocarpa]|uniref:Ribosome biogenesis regulatory protein n=1 Tax=Riccia sorocarpa TaxID=122646 RepID=A0ABD3IAI0_9MARC
MASQEQADMSVSNLSAVRVEPADLYAIDLGNLMVFDPRATISSADECLVKARDLVQALNDKLYDLPATIDKVGRIVTLPPPSTRLPREKPIPKPRPPTKWEVFAQKKGITKRKRSKLEYDEQTDEWRRRHGYKRVNDENEIPWIDAKDTDAPGEDPFEKLKVDRQSWVARKSRKKVHSSIRKQLREKGGKGAFPFLPVVEGRGASNKEREQLGNVLSKILARHDHDILDVGKAVSKYNVEEESKRAKENKKTGGKGARKFSDKNRSSKKGGLFNRKSGGSRAGGSKKPAVIKVTPLNLWGWGVSSYLKGLVQLGSPQFVVGAWQRVNAYQMTTT